MNIFCLHSDPITAATYMCDNHIKSKMIVESAQMLANCFTPEQLKFAPLAKTGNVRSHSYFNHPSSKWVRETIDNMEWLVEHTIAMYQEKIARGYKNPHHSMDFIEWVKINLHRSTVTKSGKRTEFSIAINEKSNCCKTEWFNDLSPVEKYRRYYRYDKPFAVYSNVCPPFFMDGMKFNKEKNQWTF